MKILRKLIRYLPISRGKLLDMEKDLLTFIDMSQEYELIMRNDLRSLLLALTQHMKETNSLPKSKNGTDKDKGFMYR